MVWGKIQLQFPRKKKCGMHVPLAVHTLSSSDRRVEFENNMSQCLLQHPHSENGPPKENWETLKRCIMETAEECVGRGEKKQPDWFSVAIDTIMPLITAKREAHCRFLQTHTTAAKKEFRKHQRVVKKAVDEAKEMWISRVVKETECARKDGKQRWMCFRKLQMAHLGRRPARPTRAPFMCKRHKAVYKPV